MEKRDSFPAELGMEDRVGDEELTLCGQLSGCDSEPSLSNWTSRNSPELLIRPELMERKQFF